MILVLLQCLLDFAELINDFGDLGLEVLLGLIFRVFKIIEGLFGGLVQPVGEVSDLLI